MLAFLPHGIRGALVILLIICSTLIQFPFLMAASLMKLAIPWRPSRKLFTDVVTAIAFNWININCWLLSQATGRQNWVVEGAETLRQDEWYLITCNHQSWADILIVQDILRKRAPFLKFFLKQELIWVPVIGIAWWALDFPFMKRYTQAQIKKILPLKVKIWKPRARPARFFASLPSVFSTLWKERG